MFGETYEVTVGGKKEEVAEQKPKPALVEEPVPVPETGFRVALTNEDGSGYVG